MMRFMRLMRASGNEEKGREAYNNKLRGDRHFKDFFFINNKIMWNITCTTHITSDTQVTNHQLQSLNFQKPSLQKSSKCQSITAILISKIFLQQQQ